MLADDATLLLFAKAEVSGAPMAASRFATLPCRIVISDSMMPILDTRAPSSVPIIYKQPYNINSTFNPGSSAPFSGFSSHINDESRLRNQFFALQKCEQSVYVPPSDSDMYQIRVTGGERKDPQLFPGLFEMFVCVVFGFGFPCAKV
jgi:hypothetical protein